MVLAPEIDAAFEDGPRPRSRVPSVRLNQAGICSPHDLLQFPEFTEKAGISVVGLFRSLVQRGMMILFNVPDTVRKSATLGASDFLLLETPIRKFNLVRKENTASHDMDKLEFALDRSESVLGLVTVRHGLDDLDAEQIVRVTLKSFIAVRGDFLLPLSLCDWRSHVMRVDSAMGHEMVHSDNVAVFNVFCQVAPCLRASHSDIVRCNRLSLVLEEEDIVLVLVRVQSDLLLFTTGGIHVRMRVEVSTLSVVMSEGHLTAKEHVRWSISHALVVQGRLKLGRHESITIARVDQAKEVDAEHANVECDRDDNKAEDPRKQMLSPFSRCDIYAVSEQDPKLKDCQAADPGDGEEPNPFDTNSST